MNIPLSHRTRPHRVVILVASILTTLSVNVLVAGCTAPQVPLILPPADPAVLITPLPSGTDAVVDRVVDGDTLVVSGRRVRLIGIDTPETVKPGADVECFGPQASAATKALVPSGTPVRLVNDIERQDRYGRDLAYVYRSRDGLFVAGYLAREGFGRALSIKPNVAQRTRIAALADDARIARRGLWGACK